MPVCACFCCGDILLADAVSSKLLTIAVKNTDFVFFKHFQVIVEMAFREMANFWSKRKDFLQKLFLEVFRQPLTFCKTIKSLKIFQLLFDGPNLLIFGA
jgi:hypothetical protein